MDYNVPHPGKPGMHRLEETYSSSTETVSLTDVLLPLHTPESESASYSTSTVLVLLRILMPIRARTAAFRRRPEVPCTIAPSACRAMTAGPLNRDDETMP